MFTEIVLQGKVISDLAVWYF